MKKFFAALIMLVLIILSTSCGTKFTPNSRTLGLTQDEFNQRFLANVNALATSMGIGEQATSMEFLKKESKPGEVSTTYQLSDTMLLTETINSENLEIKEITVFCGDKSVWEIRTAEAAYVAAIKAVSPEMTSEDFLKLQKDLKFDENEISEYEEVTINTIFYSRYANNSAIGYKIFVR